MRIEIIKRRIFEFEDYIFEKRYSLELSGMIAKQDLIADNNSLSHATSYGAVWCRNLREIFFEANKIGYNFETFIDIGSGKGKACFYAQVKQPFKNIIGVDFSRPLVEIANRNKAKIKNSF